MMRLIVSILIFASFGTFAQIKVSTITNAFKGSGGLSLDENGNLFIGDFGDFLGAGDGDGLPNNIWKLDSNFDLSIYATNFIIASGNDFDNNGILYQSDLAANAIYKIVNGTRTFVTSTGISLPVGLVFDSQNNFFVCNCGSNTIRKITSTGVSTEFAAGNIFSCPNGITVDENDNLYVSNFSNGDIIKITPEGISTLLNSTPGGTTSGPSNGHLDYHQASNTLFIASHGSNKIYYLNLKDPDSIKVLAGSGLRGNDDGEAMQATFSRPNGVAVTPSGDSIYINSAIPVSNFPDRPLNPQVIRLITGVQSVLSIAEDHQKYDTFKCYPNPARNTFTIESTSLKDISNLRLLVFTMEGVVMDVIKELDTLNIAFKVSIDVSNYPAGKYNYSLCDGKEILFRGSIIKE
jgi:DNA-binding beta-propeller fold protein YncE